MSFAQQLVLEPRYRSYIPWFARSFYHILFFTYQTKKKEKKKEAAVGRMGRGGVGEWFESEAGWSCNNAAPGDGIRSKNLVVSL